jgi:hypothetical protein
MKINAANLLKKAIDRTVDDDDRDYIITLEHKKDKTKWIQLSWEMVNLAYPFDKNPKTKLKSLQLNIFANGTIKSWEANQYMTLSHSADDIETIANFIDGYVEKVFECPFDDRNFNIEE